MCAKLSCANLAGDSKAELEARLRPCRDGCGGRVTCCGKRCISVCGKGTSGPALCVAKAAAGAGLGRLAGAWPRGRGRRGGGVARALAAEERVGKVRMHVEFTARACCPVWYACMLLLDLEPKLADAGGYACYVRGCGVLMSAGVVLYVAIMLVVTRRRQGDRGACSASQGASLPGDTCCRCQQTRSCERAYMRRARMLRF